MQVFKRFVLSNKVRKNVQEFITRLLNNMPNLRIAVFAHGDYSSRNKTYVTKHVDFTNDKHKLCRFVNSAERTHGQDRDECYEFVLYEVRTKLSWSHSANKSLIMIGDSTPHPKHYRLNTLRLDWEEQAKKLFSEKVSAQRYNIGICLSLFPKQVCRRGILQSLNEPLTFCSSEQ